MGWEKSHEMQGPAPEEEQPQAQMCAGRHFFVHDWALEQWGCGVSILEDISKLVWATWASSIW